MPGYCELPALTLDGEDLVPVLLGVYQQCLVAVYRTNGDVFHFLDQGGALYSLEDLRDTVWLLGMAVERRVDEHVHGVDIADGELLWRAERLGLCTGPGRWTGFLVIDVHRRAVELSVHDGHATSVLLKLRPLG